MEDVWAGKRWNYGAREHDGRSTSFAHPACTRYAWQLIWVKGIGKGLWPARTRPAHLSCNRARISASMRGRRLKWKRTGNYGEREKWWALPLLLKHPSCTHARTSGSMRGGRLKGKRTGNYGARENDGRFPSFSRTLHVLARACQLVCVEGIWRESERGIIARKNRMDGPPHLRPLYILARLSLVSLSIPLNACRAGYRSAFSRVAIFTRLLAQMAHSDIPEKVRYYS